MLIPLTGLSKVMYPEYKRCMVILENEYPGLSLDRNSGKFESIYFLFDFKSLFPQSISSTVYIIICVTVLICAYQIIYFHLDN